MKSGILRNLIFANYVYIRFYTLDIYRNEVLHLILKINIYIGSHFEFESCILLSYMLFFFFKEN